MVNRGLDGEKKEVLVYFDSSAYLHTQILPPLPLVIPTIFASKIKFSTTYITDKNREILSVVVVEGIPM